MTAARTKQHEGKDTGIRKEKIRIVGSKAKKGKKILLKASMSIVTKASRLFYKAEPGTLSHDLPSSSYSRRQRYQVSELQLLSSPSVNKLTRTKQYYQDSEDVATHVFHVHIYIHTGTCQDGRRGIWVRVGRRLSVAGGPWEPG